MRNQSNSPIYLPGVSLVAEDYNITILLYMENEDVEPELKIILCS